jgi:hypothetical protein
MRDSDFHLVDDFMTPERFQIEVDLPGRVRNMRLAPSNALYALYEGVVNSIHAIIDSPTPEKGRIDIHVLRGEDQRTLSDSKALGPVTGFTIHDNGIGFDDSNFASFRRSDSTTKAKYGGKGVGRLLWLKVLQSITIESVYVEESVRLKRNFKFTSLGIDHHLKLETTEDIGTRYCQLLWMRSFRRRLVWV